MLGASWTSLEIAKLVVAAMIPLAVVVLGFPVSRAARRLDQRQWTDRKLIELRLGMYETMAEPINDLLCFFRLVGHFQEITPPVALQRKRELDRTFYVNRYLMDDEFADRYKAFINACFLMYVDFATPAQLRASLKRQRAERGAAWDESWNWLLVSEQTSAPTGLHELGQAHDALMSAFSRLIGVGRADRPGRRRIGAKRK